MPDILRDRPETFLLFVGPEVDADYSRELRGLIDHYGIGDRVRFVGEVADVHPYLQSADIMTFASRQEGFGMVVPEAQVNGLPVVVRHLPEVNDLFVKDGQTGFFFTDDAAYVDAVLRLAGDAELRREVGASARVSVRATFDMSRVARRYLDIYGIPQPDGTADSTAVDQEVAEINQLGGSGSVVNRRLHVRAIPARSTAPLVVTLIDAEEAFDWSTQPFPRAAADVTSMSEQFRAQRVFERYGVVPTYMVDYPVATQSEGRDPLRDLLRDGRCDIGAQLHPWVTPPLIEELTARHSYPGNLPVALEYEKLNVLTKAIEDGLGVQPLIYRAGRFGAGPRTGDILRHSDILPIAV